MLQCGACLLPTMLIIDQLSETVSKPLIKWFIYESPFYGLSSREKTCTIIKYENTKLFITLFAKIPYMQPVIVRIFPTRV